MARPRALVVGGSLGGLFAANLLRHVGWEVTVFERVEEDLATRGAGIGTHDELFAVMQRIGLIGDEPMGVEVRSRICLDRYGRITHDIPLVKVLSAWARFYRPLRDALPPGSYRAGILLDRVEQDARGVTAIFSDGSRETGDLLVAADGIRSTVRAQFLPQVQPSYAGYIAWRGIVEERDVSPATHALLFHRYAFCLPEGELLAAYPVPGRDNDTRSGRRGYNFVWYRPVDAEMTLPALCTDATGRRHGLSIAPPLIRPEVVDEIRATARALLAPPIAEIIERTAQPFFQPIFDLTSPQLVFGRVALLGDAAFVARPHVGAGVTKAALDAQCLADAVAGTADLDAALAHYERERRRFGDGIVACARRVGAHLEARPEPRPETGEGRWRDPEAVMRETGARLKEIPELAGIVH
jgi:2-polyprenyl-6-methoxyphenol hydroxylase-like FAD-dependent oxidoreductase